MASKGIKGINIKIGADTTGLDTALKGIESTSRKTTSELGEINRSLRNNNDSVVLWKQKQELLTTAVEESKKKLDFLREAQEQIKKQFENGEIDGGQYRAFQREIESAERQTRDFESQLQQANTHLEELTRTTEESAEQVDELGEELQESGQQAENSANGGYTILGNVFANLITEGIKLAGTALKDFTQDVVVTGMEYEAAISNVAAISGAMAEEVEMLQAKAEEMGATTKFTAAESAEAMGYMAMAGWKVNDMVSGLDGIMDLSAASGENLASVSDIVTDSLTAFGLQAGDSAHFADVLAAASSNANTNVAMMGETFKYSAPLAGTMGYSIEDMAISVGLMANSGIKASQAGTSLNTALSRLAKPTKEMKSYMQDLGLVTMQTFNQASDPRAIEKAMTVVENKTLSAENAQIKLNQAIEKYGENSAQALTATNNLTKAQNSLEEAQQALADLQNGETASIIDKNLLLTDEEGNLKSLRETVDTLRDAFSELSEVEQAEAASAIFGKNSMSGMLAIVNAKQEDYDKLEEAVDNADGTAKDMASTMLDNLQGDKTLLDSAVDGMKIAVSKELNPALRDLVQYATSQIPKIQKAIEPITDFVTKAVKNVPKLFDTLEKGKPIISGIGTVALEIFAGIKITQLTKSIKTSLIPAVKSLWGVVSAHPWGAVLTAVGLVATAATKSIFGYLDAQLEVKSEAELLIEKHNEELQLLHDKRRAIEDLNDAFYENVDGIQNQTDRTKDLWNELDKLADQYGNVQQKDKTHAEYILNELNEALGTEYTMTGNQIDNYKLLSAEIDNVIAKKQAEMMLDAYLANSTEMTKQRIEARTDYENADKDYQEKQKIADDAEKTYRELTGRDSSEISLYSADISKELVNLSESQAEYDAGMAVYTARIDAMSAEDARTQAKNNYEATSEYFEKLDDLQEAYSLGQYDRMAEIIYAEKDLTGTTLDESATDAEQRLQIYSDSLQKTISDFELAVKDMRQKSVDEMEKEFSDTMQKALQAGVDPAEVWGNFSDGFKELQANGLDISSLITPLVESGATPAEIFGIDWQDIFKTQLKNGGDMTSMLEWLNNSNYGKGIEIVFGDNKNFMKYLKEQSAQGTDVSSLLEYGIKSGLSKSEDFVRIFKANVSKNLVNEWDVGNLLELGSQWGIDLGDEFGESFGEQMVTLNTNGVDLITFIKWAESQGKSVAKVFGENFQAELSEYLRKDKLEKLETAMPDSSPLYQALFGEKSLTDRLVKQFADGKDISSLIRQAQKQGLKVGDVFGENYTEVIQQQIDNGWSITELLEWGETSGIDTGTMLGTNYTDEVQKFVDSGFEITSLLEWAERAGINAGQLFGENFQNFANMYIEDKQTRFESVVENAKNFLGGRLSGAFRNLSFMADGGFLHNGQAVVAEAGPELLEVMNGGVKVTPLTRSAQNTSVSGGVQNVYYSNYTINATISGSYDVRRLAEDLETEKQRSDNGRGVR